MHKFTRRRGPLAAVLSGGLLACAGLLAQPVTPPSPPAGEGASGIRLSCEVFCSETKLRTANARIRWTLAAPAGGPRALGLGEVANAAQRLETTVFKDGFEKGLYASFPTLEPGRRMEAAPTARSAMPTLRAYELEVIEVEQSSGVRALAAGGDLEGSTVVEGLEPGMSYTWRIVLETAGGRLVSGALTCQAPVCPADLREE
jgi:hypothetical protein